MKSVISIRMDEDPVFFKKFSQLIDETIKSFLEKRLTEAQYLASMMKIRNDFVHGTMEGTPTVLSGKQEARAFYGIIKSSLFKNGSSDASSAVNEKLAHAGVEIDSILQKLLIRDWYRNEDVQKKMKNEVEDYLLAKRGDFGVEISFEQIDGILEDVLRVAKTVYK
jgi:type I restriction enzyme R subunit